MSTVETMPMAWNKKKGQYILARNENEKVVNFMTFEKMAVFTLHEQKSKALKIFRPLCHKI